jgi:hypothetical protein
MAAAKKSYDARSVQELQALAGIALAEPATRRRKALSRAGQLHMIDILSRWSAAALALISGVSILTTLTIARQMPMRGAVWSAMVFSALFLCARYRKDFRTGEKIASRPFRWRANYTSALAVLSTAFGSGAFILAPAGSSTAAMPELFALLAMGALGASALSAAHPQSAAAAALPTLVLTMVATFRAFGDSPIYIAAFAAAVVSVSAVAAISLRMQTNAGRKFPRTGFIRSEFVHQEDISPAGSEVPANVGAA